VTKQDNIDRSSKEKETTGRCFRSVVPENIAGHPWGRKPRKVPQEKKKRRNKDVRRWRKRGRRPRNETGKLMPVVTSKGWRNSRQKKGKRGSEDPLVGGYTEEKKGNLSTRGSTVQHTARRDFQKKKKNAWQSRHKSQITSRNGDKTTPTG